MGSNGFREIEFLRISVLSLMVRSDPFRDFESTEIIARKSKHGNLEIFLYLKARFTLFSIFVFHTLSFMLFLYINRVFLHCYLILRVSTLY